MNIAKQTAHLQQKLLDPFRALWLMFSVSVVDRLLQMVLVFGK